MAKMSEYSSVNTQPESVKARYMKDAMILSSGPKGSEAGKTNLNIPVSDLSKKQSDWNVYDTTDPAYIKNKPDIPVVKQADWEQEASGQPDFIKNKPVLSKVATSGKYSDLTGLPEIKEQVNADWNQTNPNSKGFIENKPDLEEFAKQDELADVAYTGDYSDLDNTPKNLSDFNNDSGFTNNKGTVTKIKANDKTFEPNANGLVDIGETYKHADWNQTNPTAMDYIENKPDFAEVAFSGDYSDIENAPNALSAFLNDMHYQTSEDVTSAISGKANKSEMKIEDTAELYKKTITLKNNLSVDVITEHQDIEGKANKSELQIAPVSGDPTKKNIQLLDGIKTDVVIEHQDISGKADKSSVYSKTEVDTALSGKQDTISDLENIRDGAEAGATAVQDDEYVHTDNNFSDDDYAFIERLRHTFEGGIGSDGVECNYNEENDSYDLFTRAGCGITIDSTSEYSVATGKGLNFDNRDRLQVNAGNGLGFNNDEQLVVKLGSNLSFDEQGRINADIPAIPTKTSELENDEEFATIWCGHTTETSIGMGTGEHGIFYNYEDGEIQVCPGSGIAADGGVYVRKGDGLGFEDDGTLVVKADTGLDFDKKGALVVKVSDDFKINENAEIAIKGGFGISVGTGVELNYDSWSGLNIDDDNRLYIKIGDGITCNNDHNKLSVDAGDGLGFNDNGQLIVKTGDGLNIDANGNLNADKDVFVVNGYVEYGSLTAHFSTTIEELYAAHNANKTIEVHCSFGNSFKDHDYSVLKLTDFVYGNNQDTKRFVFRKEGEDLEFHSPFSSLILEASKNYTTDSTVWKMSQVSSQELPDYGSGYSYDSVLFLPHNPSTSGDTQDPPDWRSLSDILPEVREVPESSVSDAGKVLTVKSNGEPDWTTPSGGGGTPTAEAVNMIYNWNPTTRSDDLESVSMTPEQALQKYASGVALSVNVIRKFGGKVGEIYSYPASYMYMSDDYYPIIFFNYGEGSGGGEGVTASINPDDATQSTWSRT